MKFKVERQGFHRAIATVESIIPAREIRSVMSNVMIEVKKDNLILTATDLEMGIRTVLQAENTEDGSVTLPADRKSVV